MSRRTVIAVAEPTPPPTGYSPSRIDALLRRWPEIVALAMNPYLARGLVRPNVETRDAPRFKLPKGYHHDAMGWACVVGDIEHAWMLLLGDVPGPQERLRWRIVGLRMQGRKIGEIGVLCRVRTEVVVAEYGKATMLMSETLEGGGV